MYRCYVAGKIFRIYEMVARIHITVMFHNEIAAASGSISAGTGLGTAIPCKGGIEQVYEISADIRAPPLIEYIAHESAKALRRDRPAGKICSGRTGRHYIWPGFLLHTSL